MRQSSAALPLVSIIMTFFNEERFIGEAIASVFAQSHTHWELLLVDDGSRDRSTPIARRISSEHASKVLYLEHPKHENCGISASRNLGISRASGEYLAFLDADDVYLPRKLELQLEAFRRNPEAALVYASTKYWNTWKGSSSAESDLVWDRFGVPANQVVRPPDLLVNFLSDGDTLPCMGSLLVRRETVNLVGGFESEFRGLFEDQVFLAKISSIAPVLPLSDYLDLYRQHDSSICATVSRQEVQTAKGFYLQWLGRYLERIGLHHEALNQALQKARDKAVSDSDASNTPIKGWAGFGRNGLKRLIQNHGRWRSYLQSARRWRRASRPRPGFVRFGSFRRTSPISRTWGQDRGRPLDRYYVENFLRASKGDVKGRVLEIGDNEYTRQFGGTQVNVSDVLHVKEGNPVATFVGDLTNAPHIPSATFDCVILTQTLQLIFDITAALHTLRRLLKPGGVLLATFPGITHTGDAEWGENWCWSFTRNSTRRLFHSVFGETNVSINAHGNVLAATAFLYGLTDSELRREELDAYDPSFDVVITVRAVRQWES